MESFFPKKKKKTTQPTQPLITIAELYSSRKKNQDHEAFASIG